MSEQFTRRQVELILRRTAELERRGGDSLDTITPDDLEKVASELGLSQEALRQAIAESRAGMLAPEQPKTLLDRFFGETSVEARRFVPGDVPQIRAAVARFFEQQGFQIKRHHGETTVWEAATGVWIRMRRAFRAGPYRIPRDAEVAVRIARVPGGPHPVAVQLRVDASRLRGSSVTGATAGMILGGAIAATGAVLLHAPVELATWAAGGVTAVGAAAGSRSSYRNARARLQTALERFLDFLEHEPPQLAARPQPDMLSRLVEFLSGEWWR